MNIPLGHDRKSGNPIHFPQDKLNRHFHLIGASGSGKTTALVTFLVGLFMQPVRKPCVVIVDRLGGFSADLLHWFASGFCPDWVRKRLLYIQPSMEDVV